MLPVAQLQRVPRCHRQGVRPNDIVIYSWPLAFGVAPLAVSCRIARLVARQYGGYVASCDLLQNTVEDRGSLMQLEPSDSRIVVYTLSLYSTAAVSFRFVSAAYIPSLYRRSQKAKLSAASWSIGRTIERYAISSRLERCSLS